MPENGYKKFRNTKKIIYSLTLIGIGLANGFLKIIKPEQFFLGLCFISVIIYLCVERLCQRDEIIAKYELEQKKLDDIFKIIRTERICNKEEVIEKEKTIRQISQKDTLDKNSNMDKKVNDNDECPIYQIKRHIK